jgi:Protein of unknown function (DUF1153)
MREHDETKLPTLYSKRWTIRRKAALIEAIRRGGITLEQARRLYALSVEEIRSWERQLERHGLHGLRATRVQIYPRHKD